MYRNRIWPFGDAGERTQRNRMLPLSGPGGFIANAIPLTTTSTNVSWTAPKGTVDSYRLERSLDKSTWSTVASGLTTLTADDTGRSESTKYYYRVISVVGGIDKDTSEMTETWTVPSTPTGLSATAISGSQINLAWTDVSTGNTGQIVERRTPPTTGTYSVIATVGATTAAYNDETVSAGVSYEYRVAATNPATQSAYSTAASATTPSSVPTTPVVTVGTVTSTSIALSWTSTGADTYTVEWSADGVTYQPVAEYTVNTATSVTDSGLIPDTSYEYRVRATNAFGNSGYGTANAATLPSIPTPTYDSNFTTMSTLDNVTNAGWTYSRSGLATYIDTTGTVRYGRHNLCLQSETMGSWSLAGTTVTSNVTTDPFSGSNADRVNEDTTPGSNHGILSANAGVSSVRDYVCTYSVYVKEDTASSPVRPTVILTFGAGSASNISMAFDLRNGVTLGSPSIRAGTAYTDYGITSVGNGWYRCWLRMQVSYLASGNTLTGGVYLTNTGVGVAPTLIANGGAIQYNGAGSTAGLFAFGGQIEVASAPQSYIPTTTAAVYWPRLNSTYGLLLEQGVTNLLNWSETFATSGGANNNWVLSSMTTSTGSTSPDGVTTSVRFTHNGSLATASVASSAAIGTTALRAFSVWVRRVTGTGNVWYSYDNGTTKTNFTGLSTSWQRYEFVASSFNHQIALGIDTVGDAVEFWGAQLEASAGYPSQYISTANAQVARASETCEIRAAQATFLSASAGTLVTEAAWTFALPSGSSAAAIIRLGQGGVASWYGSGNFTWTGTGANNGYIFAWNYNPTQIFDSTTISPVSMAFRKAGFKYVLGTSMRGWLNGTAGTSLTPSASMTTLDKVDLACQRLSVATVVPATATSRVGGAWFKRIRYWNSALSDADMTSLTT